ncbi:MAG: hypothetical protein IT379_18445, partial [Deltaproteobacteria bacterium]|nr:hypothetical protein [Deltaproteobacteria bacterium]
MHDSGSRRLGSLVLLPLTLACCTGEPEGVPGVELSSATYVLRFDREGLDPLETRGFALRTDRGYDVRLTGAY